MCKITLAQLLQYYDMEDDPVDRIQIVMPDQDWDDAADLPVDSELLIAVSNFTVVDMQCLYTSDNKPVIRVGLSPISPLIYAL